MVAALPAPFDASWPAVAESVPAARHAVLHYLRAVETADPPLSDVGLAVSEAVTNAVVHGYLDREPGDVRVQIEFTSDELELVVEDDGSGMCPRPDSPGLGLGLPVIASLAERFDTRSEADRGTHLCIWFRREPGAATLPA